VAVTVPNINEATSFFEKILGCEKIFRVGPYPQVGAFGKMLDVPEDTELVGFQLMRCGFGSNLEIFEYSHPRANKNYPSNQDVGGHHLAFYVGDIDAEIEKLKTAGIQVLGEEANVNANGPNGGSRWIYFKTPWGMTLELVSYPEGMNYEAETDRLLWDPRHPEK